MNFSKQNNLFHKIFLQKSNNLNYLILKNFKRVIFPLGKDSRVFSSTVLRVLENRLLVFESRVSSPDSIQPYFGVWRPLLRERRTRKEREREVQSFFTLGVERAKNFRARAELEPK